MPPDTKDLSIDEVREILKRGSFEGFLGAKENDVFEAKPVDWIDLTENHQINNCRIGRSVASLANQKGGFIVVGLNAPRRDDVPSEDVVSEIGSFAKDRHDFMSIKNRVSSTTHPTIPIEVDWYPSQGDASLGVIGIFVPPQPEDKKYFFVRATELDGQTLRGEYWGVPVRERASTEWIKVETLYSRTKMGPNDLKTFHASITAQIDEVKDLVRTRKDEGVGEVTDVVNDRINNALHGV